MGTQFWVVQAFNGVSYGALLFLVGAGLSLIFGVMRIVNLSHGSYFLLGGYVALSVIGTTGSWLLSIPIATLTIAVVGLIMAILDVQDIHTYYGDAYVLQGLSLQLEQGHILGLLGRNGVGKTTLVNSIVGFNPPRRGKIVFKGNDITRSASFETVRSGMGLVPQGRRVFPTLSVEENLLVAEGHTERHGWNLQRVYKLFPRLHVNGLPGQRQTLCCLSLGRLRK